ncbi:MAG: hypothetical protein D3M94_14765 [Rhodocyclales bacterium GT-UBC]|nr:MAG: hypothetical protein D3M94_14765 [Rhodocyclales bacterium GT-UBC]
MADQDILTQLEQLTKDMLATAQQEKWIELAALEDQRRTLLAAIDTSTLKATANQDHLQRIVEHNQNITQRLRNRQADIKFLLDAFDDPLEKAVG